MIDGRTATALIGQIRRQEPGSWDDAHLRIRLCMNVLATIANGAEDARFLARLVVTELAPDLLEED